MSSAPGREETIAVWIGTYHGDPTTLPAPWAASGPGTFGNSNNKHGRRITHVGPGLPSVYTRQFVEADTPTAGPSRSGDALEVQYRLKGISGAPGWPAPAIGFTLSDGYRQVGIAIGDGLQWINPETGQGMAKVQNWPWLSEHTYILRKDGSGSWMLFVDGKLVSELAYLRAPPAPDPLARTKVGVLDGSGSGTIEIFHMEAACNLAVAPIWTVNRYLGTLPNKMTRNLVLYALVWMMVGTFERAIRGMVGLWRDMTADRLPIVDVTFRGDTLPNLENPRWTLFTPGNISIVRERVRLVSNGAAEVRIEAITTAPHASISFDPDVEFMAAATFIVREYTADPDDRVGPFLLVNNGHRAVIAQLFEDPVGGFFWQLADGTSGIPTRIGRTWPVNALAEHHVELQVLGRDAVVLLIDRQVVEMQPYARFTVPGAAPYRSAIAVGGTLGSPTCTADVRDGEHAIRLADQAFRPLLVTSAIERTLHVGGLERMDLIETWAQRFTFQVPRRGTSRGILMELDRLTSSSTTEIVKERAPASWYLELSYPEVTPIFLEVAGDITDVFVEFTNNLPPNFDAAGLAAVARRYLVPLSSAELEYFICVKTVLTVLAPAPASGRIVLTVDNANEFEVGDAVTLRNAANTLHPDTTIVEIPAPTTIIILAVSGSFPAGSVLRKVLATT